MNQNVHLLADGAERSAPLRVVCGSALRDDDRDRTTAEPREADCVRCLQAFAAAVAAVDAELAHDVAEAVNAQQGARGADAMTDDDAHEILQDAILPIILRRARAGLHPVSP